MAFIERIIMQSGWAIRKFGELIHDFGLQIHFNRKYGKE